MYYISLDKDIYIEKYVINRYFLCIDKEKYLINEAAYEIITRLDGTRCFKTLVKELMILYNDTEENVTRLTREFFQQMENDYNINIVEKKCKEIKSIKVIGNISYYPQNASIEITEKCNLKCLHCYGNFGNICSNVMSLDNVKKIINDLETIGVKTIELTGGDISTHANLDEIINFALHKSFSRINLLTNGVILREETVELIIKNKDRMEIQIDLHSLNDDYLTWFTQCSNTSEIIKERIDCLSKNDVPLRIATIFTSKNLDEFKDIAEWVSKRNLRWGIGLVERLGRAKLSDRDLYLNNEQIVKFQELLEDANNKYPGMIAVLDYHPNDYNCGAMTSHVVIDSYGKIKLCTMDDGTYFNNTMGNCINETIKNNYDNNIELIKLLTTYQLPDEGSIECKNCEQLYACGHCILRNFINMKERNFQCDWYKERMPITMKSFFFGG